MRPKAFRLLCFLFLVAVCSSSALAQSNAEGTTKPADDKRARNYFIARMMVETLEGLGLRYPKADKSALKLKRRLK